MSTTTATKPELFPLTIDGKTEWVKRGQYSKSTAENMAIKLKADIKKAHVDEMLDAIEKGTKEVNEAAPEEMKKTFDKVFADYDLATEHKKEEIEAEEEKKREEERLKKEKEEAEDTLVNQTKEKAVSLADLSKLFDTGERMDRFVAKKDVDDATLLSALKAGLGMSEFSNWMVGDLVVALEDRGQLGVVSKLCEQMGKPYANIYNAAKTARNVPPAKRTPGVSYTIFAEIANAKYSDKAEEHKAKMIELVDKAAKGEIPNSQEARKLKNEAAGKKPPEVKLPEEDPKAEFIVCKMTDGEAVPYACVGFPKEAFEDGATVINKKTGKKFQSFRSKPENRWADLDILPAKEEKKEEAPAKKGSKKK